MSLIHLVRHGQASAGTDNYDRLSSIGEEQSRILGNWWLAQGFSPDAAFHGSLVRQRDTAKLSLAAIGDNDQLPSTQEHAGLNEYNHREIEGFFALDSDNYTPEAMSFDDYMGILQRWSEYKISTGAEQIEPWNDFKARGLNTIRELAKQEDDDAELVFFTSGGVIATVLSTVLDLDFEHTVDAIWRIRNTSVTTFSLSSNSARLVEFNSISHLLEQRKSHLITMI